MKFMFKLIEITFSVSLSLLIKNIITNEINITIYL